MDSDPTSNSIDSVYEKLSREGPVKAINLSVAGAGVLSNPNLTKEQKLFGIDNLQEQIDKLEAMPTIPDFVLVWLGHNDVNLINHGYAEEQLKVKFRNHYLEQLSRLATILNKKDPFHRKTILAFALINFENAFDARNECGRRKKLNPALFPQFKAAIDNFGVLKMEQQSQAASISHELNALIFDAVEWVNLEHYKFPNIEVRYSEIMQNLGKITCDDMNSEDAYHPGIHGHQILADAFYEEIEKSLSSISH